MLRFEDICGYEQVKEHMKNAVREHRPAHAYIISGPALSGKKTLATAFAAALLCEEGSDEPCLSCTSCHQIDTGNHPDLINVVKTKTVVGIDDVKDQLINTIVMAPYKSEYKIYVIDEAETMKAEAQNALLKTLEEPPEYAVIILLTTAKDRLLPTVISRCVNLDLRPVNEEEIVKFLMSRNQIPDYTARLAAGYSGGNPGKALSLATNESFMELQSEVLDILANVTDAEPEWLIDKAKHMADHKLQIDDLFDIMTLWYRDVLIYKATADANAVRFSDRIIELRRVCEQVNYEDVRDILDTIEKSRKRVQANVNLEVVMELLLFDINRGAAGK